jgi:hypothetical protein
MSRARSGPAPFSRLRGVPRTGGLGGSVHRLGAAATWSSTAAATPDHPAHPAPPGSAGQAPAPHLAAPRFSAATLTPDTTVRERLLATFQLEHAPADGGLADPGQPSDGPDTAIAQQPGFGRQQQPPLPLIQMRQQDFESQRKLLVEPVRWKRFSVRRDPCWPHFSAR